MTSLIWDKMAKRYDKRFENLYQDIFQVIVPQISGNDRVLEIGCGTGLLSFEIIPKVRKFTGYDISQKMIDVCNEKLEKTIYSHASFFKSDGNTIPDLLDYDKILIVNVLHIVNHPNEILTSLTKNLSKNSKILILSYCHGEKLRGKYRFFSFVMNLGSKLGLMGTLHRFTFSELRNFLTQNGLNIIYEQTSTKNFPFLFAVTKLNC